MNYQHNFHAGSACDVIKHTTLLAALNELLHKESAFCYLDTHAGSGEYDLTDIPANKTAEYKTGVIKLKNQSLQHPILQAYEKLTLNFKHYPGSPKIAQSILRTQDEMQLIEKHIDVYQTLKNNFRDDDRAHVHHADGYLASKGLMPPKSKRGLVFIDPPYEDPNEFHHLLHYLTEAYKRWATGIYMIWYPIKARHTVDIFLKKIKNLGLPKTLIAEFCFWPDDVPLRLNGSGMVIVNAPWKLESELNAIYTELLPLLRQHPAAEFNLYHG